MNRFSLVCCIALLVALSGAAGAVNFNTPMGRLLLGSKVKPVIALSNATVASTATVGTTIGSLSVVNGIGSYTFTLTSNPGTLFSISGSSLQVAAALTAGSDPITIHADNGAGGVITQPFTITVSSPGGGSVLLVDNSSTALLVDNINAACLVAGGC